MTVERRFKLTSDIRLSELLARHLPLAWEARSLKCGSNGRRRCKCLASLIAHTYEVFPLPCTMWGGYSLPWKGLPPRHSVAPLLLHGAPLHAHWMTGKGWLGALLGHANLKSEQYVVFAGWPRIGGDGWGLPG